ncbi:glycosyltransferase [Lactobacillus delbrueckii]|uniref:glycosyltransferase n=1 Tax=Lactobacillus delbrueckii TaxID=1584 RepID=UPI0019D17DB6|nr:glycosyl transferase [Lactobacillus delbrueckii subsp. bulgaricus]
MLNRIPKIIHYCWFGENEMPEVTRNIISQWHTILPEYQFILWNEGNFDVGSNQYTSEAYAAKKYAFVSDYVRLYALSKMGGIYLDTDVVVNKKFDNFLNEKAFLSFESNRTVSTAVIGAEKGAQFINTILKQYKNKHFLLKNGQYDEKPNSELIFKLFFKHEMDRNQIVKLSNVTFYSVDYFCAKDYKTYESLKTSNTVCIHMLDATWYTGLKKIKREIKQFLIGKLHMGFLWKE